ncbi:MAG TPA: asparaginase [Methylibium sp.]|nr:asparaginase [Methylibium sp.]
MQALSNPGAPCVVVLATGGTIAGTAASATDSLGYRSAQLGVDALIAAVPVLAGRALEAEQVAQIDSKDMDFGVWRALAHRVEIHLARPEVAGIVVTHGTDTLEETAYLLQRVLAPSKPVVLTAAMRPATALQADGPQNLLDAVTLAAEPGARGVLAVVAGRVHGAFDVRKSQTYRLDAFGSGDPGVLAAVEGAAVRRFRDWPTGAALGTALLDAAPWPRVDIVTSHAGADGRIVDALLAQGVDGLVVAGTGNATLHHALEAALLRAAAQGVEVRCCTRVPEGGVHPGAVRALPLGQAATPQQERVALLLDLLQRRR